MDCDPMKNFTDDSKNDNILNDLFVNEAKYYIPPSEIELNVRQIKIRSRVADWILKFRYAYDQSLQTALLAIRYFDSIFISLSPPEKYLQLFAATSLWIASKYHEGAGDKNCSNQIILHACYIACSEKYKREDFILCERIMLSSLSFSLTRCTPLDFLEFVLSKIEYKDKVIEECLVRSLVSSLAFEIF
jgi:hypothetical protein